MKLPIPPLGQRDTRWSRKILGTKGTIGSYGCLLTCHTMMLNYFGHDFTPDTLNAVYKEKEVYHDGNLISFYDAGDVFQDVKADEFYNCITTPCDLKKVDEYLDKKLPVIAYVDNVDNDKRPDHFVLIIGKDEHDKYFINDPWMGETYYFHAKYGEPDTGIYGLRLYSGTPKDTESIEDKLNDVTDKLKSCNETVADKSLEVNSLRDALEQQEKDNKDLANQLLKARGERDSAVFQKERVEIKSKSLEEEIESLKSDKGLLEKELSELKEDKVENWLWTRLIWEGIKKKLSYHK